MPKLLTILGARPQFIKAATVSRALTERKDIDEVLVHTGQHSDSNMSDVFFKELQIPPPSYHLGITGGGHAAMTGQMLERIEPVLKDEKPDCVLVYGDTNSTLAGALAAAKIHIPVAHIEAGLRSFNRRMPEEINRVLTDHLSDLLFTPTDTATARLGEEGISFDRIHQVGDVMYDAALFYRDRARMPRWFTTLGMREKRYVLATVHRAENTETSERLNGIFDGLARSDRNIILPLHPRTRQKLSASGFTGMKNIHVVPPVGYLEMVWLVMNCHLVATDSGGLQKEAYFHGKPCITLREETEWVELVQSGWNTLVGADPERIAQYLSDRHELALPPSRKFYGNGDAAEKILSIITCS